MKARLRKLHADQSGFSLPELITGMAIGLVVLMAAFMLLDRAVSGSTKLADRQEAVQRGRLTMEKITQQLRSQVCLDQAQPIVAGDNNSVTFYANLSSNPNSAQKRAIRYVAAEKRFYQDVYTGTGTFPKLTFPASPTTSAELLRPVTQTTEKVGTTYVVRPIFRFYKYVNGTTTGQLQLLSTPLSAADAPEVVMINIAFATLPVRKVERTSDIIDATTFDANVYVREADPSRPSEGPACA